MNGINGSQPPVAQPERPERPTTVEGLNEMVTKMEQYIDLFRQQRDRAVALANDLQVELAIIQNKLNELQAQEPRPQPYVEPSAVTP